MDPIAGGCVPATTSGIGSQAWCTAPWTARWTFGCALVLAGLSCRTAEPLGQSPPEQETNDPVQVELVLQDADGAPMPGARVVVFWDEESRLRDPHRDESDGDEPDGDDSQRDGLRDDPASGGPQDGRGDQVETASVLEGALGWYVRRQAFAPGANEVHAYVGPRSVLEVRPGPVTLVVARGHARPVRHTFDARRERRVVLDVSAADPHEGWACADLHLHGFVPGDASEHALGNLLEIEGLDAAAFVDWAGRVEGAPRSEHWGGFAWTEAELSRRESAGGALLMRAQAWARPERTCAMHVFGHRTPVAGISKHSRAHIVATAQSEGGWVSGALGRIFVEGALRGDVATSEVLSLGRFHRLDEWYDLLNVGARIGAIAGTDAQFGARPQTLVDYHAPLGANRVCVAIEDAEADPGAGGEVGQAQLFAALEAGHSYVTSGPALSLRVGGEGPGSVTTLSAPQMLPVRVAIHAVHAPVGELVLLQNGAPIWTRTLGPRVTAVEDIVPVRFETSSWLALRFEGTARVDGGELPLAHTSPVYVQVGNARPFDAQSAVRVAERIPSDADIAQSGRSTEAERHLSRQWAREARAQLAR